MKNFTLNVTLKNDVFECQNDFQGTYEISDMVNDKPSWIFYEKKKAIWYDLKDKNWSIGTLENLGTSTKDLGGLHICWLLAVEHVIYLKLRRVWLICKAKQIHKMALKIVMDEQICH